MFVQIATHVPLTQGDLIDACPLVGLDAGVGSLNFDEPAMKWWKARVVVLTQACDLAQTKSGHALVARVHIAKELVDQGVLKSAAIRDHIRRHLVFGWYFLPAVTTPVALPEALIDLRDIHTIPRTVLDELIVRGNRVVTLASPYREHLAQHFAVTYMRVALPEPYGTGP